MTAHLVRTRAGLATLPPERSPGEVFVIDELSADELLAIVLSHRRVIVW